VSVYRYQQLFIAAIHFAHVTDCLCSGFDCASSAVTALYLRVSKRWSVVKETHTQWLDLPRGEDCHQDADQATVGEQYARKLQEFDSHFAENVTALLLAA
jgi:hypothetical protein